MLLPQWLFLRSANLREKLVQEDDLNLQIQHLNANFCIKFGFI